MPHEQMIDAFSAIIQNSLSLYEEQTPLYYYLTICGSWVLTALGILSLASVFFTVKQKKPYRFIVPILFYGWDMKASTCRARILLYSTDTTWRSFPIRQTKIPTRSYISQTAQIRFAAS